MRDITFGLLYQQMKAEQKFDNIMNNTIQAKIQSPLKAAIIKLQAIEDNEQFKEFIDSNKRVESIKNMAVKMKDTRNIMNITYFKFKDLQDYQNFKNGQFRMIKRDFTLQDILTRVENMTKVMADIKNL